MRRIFFLLLSLLPCVLWAQEREVRTNVPLDSIYMSDPFVLADKATKTYYMTGTGGLMWKSKDLATWSGPYRVTETDPEGWMGPRPMIWAAEIHPYAGKYYYFATFTNRAVNIDTVMGNVIERRACHVLVSDAPDGPYKPVSEADYLPDNQPTLDGTLWVDTDGKPYLVFCHEWLQNRNGTVEKVELTADLSATTGERTVLFHASDSPWSRENTDDGTDMPNMVTDGPFLFRTHKGRLGMLWSSWVHDVYMQGVAYSSSGTLDGPWIQEPEPITPPNFGHGMIFRTFDGRTLMAVHSHQQLAQDKVERHPHFFTVDTTGDKLKLGVEYHPNSL